MRIGLYPGTFDPITNGHLDIIQRSLKLVDHLIVAVVRSDLKDPLFSPEERRALIEASLPRDLPVSVELFDGLLVEFARQKQATVIVRGLRAVSDFEYEFQMALMNKNLYPEIEVIFLVPDVAYTFLSSSLVREVATLGGSVANLVPDPVQAALKRRFGPSKDRSA